MAWGDTLHLQVLGRVTRQFEDFGGQVFENGSQVDGGLCADTRLVAGDGSKMALYTTAWELL